MVSGLSALPIDEYRRSARSAIEDGAVPNLRRAWNHHVRDTFGGESQEGVSDLADAASYHFAVTHLREEQARHTGTKAVRPRGPDTPDFDSLHEQVDVDAPNLSRKAALELRPLNLHSLHRRAISPERRHELGAYYTPNGVASLAAEELDADWATDTVIDPGCGAGAFITAAARRKADAVTGGSATKLVSVKSDLAGVEIDPVAADAAVAALTATLSSEIETVDADTVTLPVSLADSVADDTY